MGYPASSVESGVRWRGQGMIEALLILRRQGDRGGTSTTSARALVRGEPRTALGVPAARPDSVKEILTYWRSAAAGRAVQGGER